MHRENASIDRAPCEDLGDWLFVVPQYEECWRFYLVVAVAVSGLLSRNRGYQFYFSRSLTEEVKRCMQWVIRPIGVPNTKGHGERAYQTSRGRGQVSEWMVADCRMTRASLVMKMFDLAVWRLGSAGCWPDLEVTQNRKGLFSGRASARGAVPELAGVQYRPVPEDRPAGVDCL